MSEIAINYGWYLNQYRKIPLLSGFSGQVLGNFQNLDAVAGFNQLDASPVPAGQIWSILYAVAYDLTSINSRTSIILNIAGVNITVATVLPTAATDFAKLESLAVLFPADFVRVQYFGCNAGDDLILRYFGYYTEISE